MNLQDYNKFIEHAWHQETARNSLDRWIDICKKEQWRISDESMEVIVGVFGASWYFTRFIFVHGEKINTLLENRDFSSLEKEATILNTENLLNFDELEDAVNNLRLQKNTIMFKALVAYLTGAYGLEKLEVVLTKLSESILNSLFQVVETSTGNQEMPITVLGMGRMAGYEMTFGSDLDLIFLFEKEDQILNANLSSVIRLLLRLVAQPSAYGQLYEVDMRLRPHGNSGPLVTTYKTFLEYHQGDREIWERQMMTRCRPVVTKGSRVGAVMEKLQNSVYSQYDELHLKETIVSMRHKVESVLGKVKSKHEIKRGTGGLMDIDFITHYFQLMFGASRKTLQTSSTRQALREMCESGYINKTQKYDLLEGYDFLKKVETALRLFDLKSADSFPVNADSNLALSRAMGFENNTTAFMEKYLEATRTIRDNFCTLVGEPG